MTRRPAALPFSQVDVFSSEQFRGNPVAVVHHADNLSDDTMAAIARWTNLSETTFLLKPTTPTADYRLRIFTPIGELPFAGHPTLGSCHAWLQSNGRSIDANYAIQECAAGLVRIQKSGAQLAFAAPPLIRTGPIDASLLSRISSALGIGPESIQAHQWVDGGPGWCAVLLDNAQSVLALRPDFQQLKDINLGVIGPYPAGSASDYEVRAFAPSLGIPEDPVTGSLNAGIAQWLIGASLASPAYTVSQGTALQRAGRIRLTHDGQTLWVGGDVCLRVKGEVIFEK